MSELPEPRTTHLKMRIEREEWEHAPSSAGNLSELELMLGCVADALRDAEQSVEFTERTGNAWQCFIRSRPALADALHQAGRRADALSQFREAEAMQAELQPEFALLYSVRGFRYCDLVLAECERAACQCMTHRQDGCLAPIERCREVEQRAAKTLEWAEAAREAALLSIALDHLTLGRAALYRAVLEHSSFDIRHSPFRKSHQQLTAAMDGLRRAGSQDHVPQGLLSRAWPRFLAGDADGAIADLDEAWQIAERGPMPLFMTDIHLHRARLFHAVRPYPWESPRHDLAEAKRLIDECGYHRRDEELADAQQAAKSW